MGLLNSLVDLMQRNKYVILILFVSSLAISQVWYDQINVDNIRLDGNTISSSTGKLILTPTSTVNFSTLTASTVPYLDASKDLVSSAITPTELGLLTGLTSAAVGISDTQTLTNKTIDPASNTITLTDGNLLIGNASNLATGVTMTGDISINNAGLSSIVSNVIVDADIYTAAAITLTKLAPTTASRALVSEGSGFISPSTTTAIEIGYVNGVTSAIQTQFAGKLTNTLTSAYIYVGDGNAVGRPMTGDISINNVGLTGIVSGVIVDADINASAAITLSKLEALTASKAVVSDASGVLVSSSVTTTELDRLIGILSSAVGISDAQVLTLKDIDGGTMSNTNRITLPQDTTTNLDLLTDKEANIAYDSTLNKVVYNDGAAWIALNTGTALTDPMTTRGDIIVRDATNTTERLAIGATNKMRLQSDGTDISWVTVGDHQTVNIVNTDSPYSAAADTIIKANAVTAAITVTLPTAVSAKGQITIRKSDTSTNAITINTTSSQTISTRASGDILLSQIGDYITVVSDNTNWMIINKRETEYLSDTGNVTIVGATGSYGSNSATITLGIGRWRLTGYAGMSSGATAVAQFLGWNTGFYAADGANNTTQPTALTNTVQGPKLWTNALGSSLKLLTVAASDSAYTPALQADIIITSGTQSVYFVPHYNYTTGTGTVYTGITANRL